MPALGSNINAALGRIDYSPIAQGGRAAAQGIMGAGQAQAQGIMALGQGLSQGIQKYQKKQEDKKIMEGAVGTIEGFLSSNPNVAKKLGLTPDPEGDFDDGAIKEVINTYGGPKAAIQSVTQLGQLIQQAGLQDRQLKLDQDNAKSIAAFRAAQIDAMGAPKPKQGSIMTSDQVRALKDSGMDYDAEPLPDGTYRVNKVSPFSKGASTTVNVASPNRRQDKRYEDLSKRREADMVPLVSAVPQVKAMEALLNGIGDDGKMITGALANVELPVKSILNKLGMGDFSEVANTQEYLAHSVTLTGQIIKQFGAGTGLSDADREYAAQAAAGQIKMDKPALKRLVAMAKRVMKDKNRQYNEDVKASFSGDDFTWERNSLSIPPPDFGIMKDDVFSQADAIIGL